MIDDSIQTLEDAVDALIVRGCSRDYVVNHVIDYLAASDLWAPVDPVADGSVSDMQLLAQKMMVDATALALERARKV